MRRGRRQQSVTKGRHPIRSKRGAAPRAGSEDSTLAEVFPAFVTLLSVLAGLYLYVHSTRPALRERAEIEGMERKVYEALVDEWAEYREQSRRGHRTKTNPEALLIELDRQDVSIEEADRRAAELLRAKHR